MKKTALSIALSALLPVSAIAAETKPIDIVITAKGQQSIAEVAPVSHVITSNAIEQSQASDLTELLDTVSGLSFSRNGGRGAQSGTFIRGATSSQITVLVDGVRISSATSGSTELGHIPLNIIDRIEVVKGPLSGLYGAGAIGGVIQIFTKKGGKPANNVELQAGSFGHIKAIASLTTSNFRASVSREENDGIDATTVTTGGNDDEDGFEETAINLGGSIVFDESTTLGINAFFADNEIEFDNTFGADGGRFTDNEISTISATLDKSFGDNTKWSTTLGLSNNDSFTEAFAVFNSARFKTQRFSLGSQGEFKLSQQGRTIVGLDYYKEEVDTDANFAETDRNNTGIFTQYQNQFGQLGIVTNLRFDDNSAYGNNTNGSIALNYALNDTTRLTASYGTAFRAPTFNALYFPFSGNPNVQPEESKTIELTLRGGINTKTQWRISAYDTEIEDLIEFPAPNFLATNTSEASLQGIELEIGTYLNQWYLSSSLDLLDATDEATSNQLIRRPETTLKVSARREFGKFSFGTHLLAEKGRFDLGNVELDSFERVDFTGAYRFSDSFTLNSRIGNAFDKDYQLASGFNTEGRSIIVSGKLQF